MRKYLVLVLRQLRLSILKRGRCSSGSLYRQHRLAFIWLSSSVWQSYPCYQSGQIVVSKFWRALQLDQSAGNRAITTEAVTRGRFTLLCRIYDIKLAELGLSGEQVTEASATPFGHEEVFSAYIKICFQQFKLKLVFKPQFNNKIFWKLKIMLENFLKDVNKVSKKTRVLEVERLELWL